MKKTIAVITSILFMFPSFSDNTNQDFGSINKEVQLQEDLERAHFLISNSMETRKWVNNGRSIAGMTQEEKKWANEFENLMVKEDNIDYLDLTLNMR